MLRFALTLLFIGPSLFAAEYDLEEKALLAALEAHPAEDTPRLVYADWLQEHGQEERARFIRLQIERVRKDPKAPPSREEAELLKKFEMRWRPKLSGMSDIRWERGFISSVTVEWAQLRDHGPSCKRSLEQINALPVVPAVVLSGTFHHSPGLQHLRALTRVRKMEIDGGAPHDADPFHSFMEHIDVILPLLPPVRHLKLARSACEAAEFRRFLNWEHAPKIQSLTLSDFTIFQEGFVPASEVNRLSGLEALTLEADAVSGWVVLLRAGTLAGLKELDLSSTSITWIRDNRVPIAADLKGRSLQALRLPSLQVDRETRSGPFVNRTELSYLQFAEFVAQLDGPCTLIQQLASDLP